MRTRLLVLGDLAQARALARVAAEESEPALGFDPDIVDRTLVASTTEAHPTCFVLEDRGRLVGFVLCAIEGFWFASGVSTCLHVIYVVPDKRGTRAAAYLLRAFLEWSDEVGARRKYLGINNDLHPDRTAKLFARAGARRVGYAMVI